MAVDQGLSLSGFVASLLEEKLDQARRYRQAMEEEKRAMREGLGSAMGAVTWTRDELHER